MPYLPLYLPTAPSMAADGSDMPGETAEDYGLRCAPGIRRGDNMAVQMRAGLECVRQAAYAMARMRDCLYVDYAKGQWLDLVVSEIPGVAPRLIGEEDMAFRVRAKAARKGISYTAIQEIVDGILQDVNPLYHCEIHGAVKDGPFYDRDTYWNRPNDYLINEVGYSVDCDVKYFDDDIRTFIIHIPSDLYYSTGGGFFGVDFFWGLDTYWGSTSGNYIIQAIINQVEAVRMAGTRFWVFPDAALNP